MPDKGKSVGTDLGAQLAECLLYKGTTLPHIVVQRRCQLYERGITTHHPDKDPKSAKVWDFERRCQLKPPDASLIRAHDRHVRKAGPLRLVTAYRDKHDVRLHTLQLEWPERHSPSGGSTIELGFESQAQAQEWWQLIRAQVSSLAAAKPPPSLSSRSTNSQASSHSSAAPATPLASTSHLPGVAGGAEASAAPQTRALLHLPHPGAAPHWEATPVPARPPGVVVDEAMVRWVPYKHSNGLAIYHRHAPNGESCSSAEADGEYMVSTTIAASPDDCVAALLSGRSAPGAVGNCYSSASFLELLHRDRHTKVSHAIFMPSACSGLAPRLCTPRETYVRSVVTSYDDGVAALLFSSLLDADVAQHWTQRGSGGGGGASGKGGDGGGDDGGGGAHADGVMQDRQQQRLPRPLPPWLSALWHAASGRWLWGPSGVAPWGGSWGGRRPVRAHVTGAITLSALEGCGSSDSPHTLVTAIMRADFGGWLSPGSLLYALSKALGLQEALMERMLMTVMTLKEEVEFSKFKTKPFQMLMTRNSASSPASSAASSNGSAGSGGGAAAQGAPGAGHSSPVRVAPGRSAALAAGGLGEVDWGDPVEAGSDGLDRGASWSDLAARWPSSLLSGLAAHMANPQLLIRRLGGGGGGGAPQPLQAAQAGEARGAAPLRPAGNAGAPARSAVAPVALPSAGSTTRSALLPRAAPSAAAAPTPQAVRRIAPAGTVSPPPTGLLPHKFWEELASPGAMYKLRGPSYLRDGRKVPAGPPSYRLLAVDLAATDKVVQHMARFLPSVHNSSAAFHFIVNIIVPGTPVLHLFMVFATDRHPDSLGPCPDDPADAGEVWSPFDLTMSRFLHGTDEERNAMFKIIPHCGFG